MYDVNRQASVRADSNARVAYIDRDSFIRLFGSMEDMLKRNQDRYQMSIGSQKRLVMAWSLSDSYKEYYDSKYAGSLKDKRLIVNVNRALYFFLSTLQISNHNPESLQLVSNVVLKALTCHFDELFQHSILLLKVAYLL